MTLTEVLSRYPDTDKNTIHSYAEVYEELLAPYRDQSITLLEIGVRYGGSLLAWRDWFSEALIVGVDNGFEDGVWQSTDPRIEMRQGDSTDPLFMYNLGSEFDGFHVVIDDGCHHPVAQAMAWTALNRWVWPGGLYVIEDVEGITHAHDLHRFITGSRVIDRRHVKHRHDDIMLVWEKPE